MGCTDEPLIRQEQQQFAKLLGQSLLLFIVYSYYQTSGKEK